MSLRRPPLFKACSPDDPKFVVAKQLAAAYTNQLKAEYSVYARPYSTAVPLEKQGIFTHFLKAAQIVLEEKGEPDGYMRAQFAGLRFCGRPPFPAQLHSSNARLRYVEWLVKHEQTSAKKVVESDYAIDEYEMQEIKLRRLMAGTGLMSERQALRMFGRQFTPAFLRSKKRKFAQRRGRVSA